jgi:hypothetical protein
MRLAESLGYRVTRAADGSAELAAALEECLRKLPPNSRSNLGRLRAVSGKTYVGRGGQKSDIATSRQLGTGCERAAIRSERADIGLIARPADRSQSPGIV